MTYDDSQVLAAIERAAEEDERIRDDIKRAIDSYDRAFFAQVVFNVLDRLNHAVSDVGRFIDSAYNWFRSRLYS